MRRLLSGFLLVAITGCGAPTAPDLGDLSTAADSVPAPTETGQRTPADPDGSADPHRAPRGGGTGAPSPEPSQGAEAAAGPPRPTGSALTPVSDLGGVGANGPAYLRGDRPRVVVEVDVQEGATVDDQALAHLRATLRDVSSTGEVSLLLDDAFASDRTSWTSADLRAAAQAHRDTYSDDTTAALYVLVVRGGFARGGETTSAIGVAYNGSEMAVFPDRWSDLTGTLLGSSAQVARAVLVHELGHLLGLVNLTYTSEIDHEDPEHPGHSSNQASAMYWAIETTAIGQVFSGPPPDTFDDADLADLEGLRTGRYTP